MAQAPSPGATDAPPIRPAASPRRRSRVALAAIVLAALLLIVAALAGFGSRWGWWPFSTGFVLLWVGVRYGLFVVGVVALVALFLTRPGAGRRGMPLALVSLAVVLVLFGVLSQWRGRAQAAAPIHDITTDTNDPPAFVAIVPLRADAPNPTEYGGAEVAAKQHEAYPEIRPLVLDLPPAEAFARALDAARDMGWEIVDANAAQGRIEATAETFWFGFKDDVVIRLTPRGGQTVVDVRSVSRVGGGDVGTNARRIRAYLDELRG